MTKHIPIYLISDERYAPCLAVTLYSVMQNTSRFMDFCVLDGGISPATKEALHNLVHETSPESSLEFITVDASLFSSFPDIAHFSRNTYYRYLIPNIRQNVDKALYLDSDILVQGDIGELFDIPLNGYPLGAVPYRYELMAEDGPAIPLKRWSQNLKTKLGLPAKHIYFNAGILLLDCAAMRRENWEARLFSLTSEKADVLECPDQDVLNLMCAESGYCILPDTWNAVTDIDAQLGVRLSTPPNILHFTGGRRMRPWQAIGCLWDSEYWSYASCSPLVNRMRQERIESELLHQKETLSLLLDIVVKLRRYRIFRFLLWLCGQGRQMRHLFSRLAAIQKQFPPPSI